MVSWHIYYADGSTFSSDDGAPENAPIDGVLVVIDSGNRNRQIVQGHDYYLWLVGAWTEDGTWAGGSRADLDRWIRAGYVRPGVVKFGLIASTDYYRRVVDKAMGS